MTTKALPFDELLSFVVDNRGRTCPTASTGLPLIATNCISNEHLFPTKENVRYVDSETYTNWFRSHPKPGDIIFVLKGAPGRCALVPDPVDFCIAQDMVAVRADHEKIDPQYLFAALRSPLIQESIDRMHVGTMIPHFKKGDFNKLLIPIPDRSTQEFIGSVHMALVEKIELNRRMNETLEAMARAIFKDWFVDFGPTRAKIEGRAPYLAPDIWSLFTDRLDDDGKPEGWIETTVGTEFNLTMGQSPPGETYNESGDGLPFFQGRTDFGFRYPVRRKFCSAPTRIARPDDTLVSVRAPVGDLNMAWEECCIGRGVAAVRHKRGGRGYTQYSMQFLQPAIARFEDSGSVFGAINKVQFERLRVISPPPELMDQFEATVQGMDDRIRSNTSETETLATTRDFLLPKLMSGEVRVKEAEKLVGEAT